MRRALAAAVVCMWSVPAWAQAQPAAPPPPPGWTGSASAGLALTQGNSDTANANLAYEVKRDTGSPFVFASTGLYLRASSEGDLTSNRLAFDGRLDRKLTDRFSVFGLTQYLRDSFKAIDYLVSVSGGAAYALVKNDDTTLDVDGGLGVVWEQNPGVDLDTSGAILAGQKFKHRLTATTEITEKVAALWKTSDLADALYTFGAGVASNVTGGIQMKVEVLDTFKNKPPSPEIEKNDVALIASLVYKF